MTQESEELYRINLEGVLEYLSKTYGDGRKVLSIKDVSTYTGKCYRWAKDHYFKKGSRIMTAENFARILAKM